MRRLRVPSPTLAGCQQTAVAGEGAFDHRRVADRDDGGS
jgi:hypothetical protein